MPFAASENNAVKPIRRVEVKVDKVKYSYPITIKFGKLTDKFLIPLLILFFILGIGTPKRLADSTFLEDALGTLIVAFFPVMLLWIHYSFSDISVSKDGIWVEFIGRDILVPWEKVVEVKFQGFSWVKTCLVITDDDQLTLFHRIYSLWFGFSIRPGFVIHQNINGYKELISTIQSRGRAFRNLKG